MGLSFGGRKAKGSVGERELLKEFWDKGWGGMRCAGSGSARHPTPDILVGNGERFIALEVKLTKKDKKYFPNKEIDDLRRFAGRFGAHPMVAVKFKDHGWYFMSPGDMRKTDKNYVASVKLGETKGLTFEELLQV